ncbi:MAG: transglycosylase domain-containing protein [Acidimicrobiales bacterium]
MTFRRDAQDAPAGSASPSPQRKRRLGRLVRRLLLVAAVAISFLVVATGSLVLAVPSVGSAAARVRSHLALHHAPVHPSPPPPRIAAAVIATEDHAFNDPPGVDIAYGGLRYFYEHLVLGKPSQGGSTIAQQLAKLLYTKDRTGPLSKMEEIGLALKLEITYSHSQLLTLYLNAAYFGQGAYGIDQATATYFGRSPSQCTWAQASMLAGLLQAPSAYDPYAHPRLARQRQLEVIGELAGTGILTPAAAHRVARSPLGLRSPPRSKTP